MRSALVLWLSRHGLPGWLAPDYAATVGIAGLLGAACFLWLARADRADVEKEKRALALAYVAALLGGYVFEVLRAVPEALRAMSLWPLLSSGRAAYGGLILGVVAPVVYLRRRRVPIAPFLDRSIVVFGFSFTLVRTGCFLAGCDYGRVTSSPLGVRFPANSPAALDHAELGWVPSGAPSLPVHPTQLYEAALGVAATAVAFAWLRRGRRDGRAFAVWIATYAAGRFAIELLRGDASRGLYAGLSTAQIVSIALLAAVAAHLSHRGRAARTATAGLMGALLLGGGRDAFAELPPPAGPASAPSTEAEAGPAGPAPVSPRGSAPASAPTAGDLSPATPVRRKDDQIAGAAHRIGLHAATAPAFTLGNARVPSGAMVEMDAVYRFPFSRRHRFQLGLELRGYRNADAAHFSLGVPLEIVLGVASHLEFNLGIELGHTWIFFDSPFFAPTNAWGTGFTFGLQFPIGDRVAIGVSPLVFNVLSSQIVGMIATYEPKLSVVVGLW